MMPARYRGWLCKAALLVFWAALTTIFVLATMPADEAPDPTGWDKANHVLAFYVLTLLAAVGYPGRSLAWVTLGLCGFGLLIEGVQLIPLLGRSAEWADLLADVAGVLVAAVPMVIVRLRQGLSTGGPG